MIEIPMTERLYYSDAYLREFSAHILESRDDLVYLDRTAFYPASGGQPADTGLIGTSRVIDTVDEGERIAHRLEKPLDPGEVRCSIDWPRRFDHMQQHSGQHLLSAVFVEVLGAATVSFHLGAESATIDLETPGLSPENVRAVVERANRIVTENRPVHVRFVDSAEARDLRKPSEREGTLRIVEMDGVDRSACGGTHVRTTGEIGPILVRKLEKIRNATRVEFLCGLRAVRRAQADFETLLRTSQLFSAALDETPAAAAATLEQARALAKQIQKLETELAGYRGRELYQATAPDAAGVRRHVQRLPTGALDQSRALAQSFTAGERAIFLTVVENPPSLLLAASADAGIDAGKIVKEIVSAAGGRGGGTARMAQGSVPSPQALQTALAKVETLIGS